MEITYKSIDSWYCDIDNNETARQLCPTVRSFESTQMQELIGTMNAFFKKMSRSNIQFQLSEQYALPKKADASKKSKLIKKHNKKNIEISPEKLKLLKKGLKKFKENKTADTSFLESTKGNFQFMLDLSEKERAKHIKSLWKALD